MKKAFSLIELSIVLVILGLLVGGILAGKSLIRASELRGVSNEFYRYQAAVFTFRGKYFQLPGDITNATSFWPAADAGDGVGTDCYDTNNVAATCNGNGNGNIYPGAGAYTTEWNEMTRAWQHLVFAGLIEGSYTGVSTQSVGVVMAHTSGVNIPASKIAGGGYRIMYRNNPSGISNQFPIVGTILFFGEWSNDTNANNILKAEEAWNIDSKMDDGKPGTGKLRSGSNNTGTPNCVDSDTASSAAYLLSDTTIGCGIIYQIL